MENYMNKFVFNNIEFVVYGNKGDRFVSFSCKLIGERMGSYYEAYSMFENMIINEYEVGMVCLEVIEGINDWRVSMYMKCGYVVSSGSGDDFVMMEKRI